jgi:hypothetical protein
MSSFCDFRNNHSNRRFQFQKRSQLFIRVHNQALSVAAMRVCNPDRLPTRINRLDTAPTPTGFAEIVAPEWLDELGRCSAITA